MTSKKDSWHNRRGWLILRERECYAEARKYVSRQHQGFRRWVDKANEYRRDRLALRRSVARKTKPKVVPLQSIQVVVRMPMLMRSQLRALAQQEGVRSSQYLRLIFEQHLEQQKVIDSRVKKGHGIE